MTTGSPDSRPLPLSGVRVLAAEQFGAGPFATMQLADLGADVIKLEDPHTGGDVGRTVPPGAHDGHSLYFEAFNRGKRSLALDLQTAAGQAVLQRLATASDVVFNNLRGDLPARLGLTFETLGPVNPQLVCASLSAYGRTGKRAREGGYDALVQAEAGWAMATGGPDDPPIKSGLSLVDYAAGLSIALAITAAVLDARQSGLGREIESSLYDVALSLLTYPATWHLSAGIESRRLADSAHPSIVPFQFFRTADGWIAIACAKEKFFRALTSAIERPDLASDTRFANFEGRSRHRDALVAELGRVLAGRSTTDWLERMRGTVPAAPVRSMAEALDPEELMARGMLAEYVSPVLGRVRHVGSPMRIAGSTRAYRAAPGLDHDRFAVLAEAGLTDVEIEQFDREGAFGAVEAG